VRHAAKAKVVISLKRRMEVQAEGQVAGNLTRLPAFNNRVLVVAGTGFERTD
jgi:hypothetical protein